MRFQWLEDYQNLEAHLVYLKWNLNKSKLELARWVEGDLTHVRLVKNSRASNLEIIIEKMEREIELLEKQKIEVKQLHSSFKGLDNTIVRLKYVEGLTLEKIAEELGYSASYIRQRHAEIRKTLEFLNHFQELACKNRQRKNEIDFYDYRKGGS